MITFYCGHAKYRPGPKITVSYLCEDCARKVQSKAYAKNLRQTIQAIEQAQADVAKERTCAK